VGEPHIVSASAVLPPHYVDQETLLAAFRAQWAEKHFNLDRLEQLHRAVRVGGRHLALPIEQYLQLDSFAKRNDAWIAAAVDLGEAALQEALLRADLRPADVDHLYFVTVTGLATPSIDARLVAGAAGVARAADAVRAFPGQIAALLAVELCSLTLQREDLSVANIIASGLFGDGAAAVLVGGGERAAQGPRIVATRSVFYPETERVMGWDIVDSGFKVVLSPEVPQLVRARVQGDVDSFLASQGLSRRDVHHWICHSGGPRVLEAFEEALELPCAALQRTWDSLHEVGNLSSASVLFVLRDLLESREAKPGDFGLLIAMGPGFCSELVLLRW
jgi:alkylresorcinol/alkylpyrone synthase